MLIVEFLIISAALVAVAALIRNQVMAQWNEYRFYKSNGWDFSVDSGSDRLKLDRQVFSYAPNLTNWQRFYLFRPIYTLNIIALFGFMVWSLF